MELQIRELAEEDTTLRLIGREYHGPCPFCDADDDGFRIDEKSNRYFCRQCTPKGGDAIDYAVRTGRINKAQAYKLRHGESIDGYSRPARPKRKPAQSIAVKPSKPCEVWLERASALVEIFHDIGLEMSDGRPYYEWYGNGLFDDTIDKFKLGWNDADRWFDYSHFGLPGDGRMILPRGLVIPHFYDNTLYAVNIRRYQDWKPETGERVVRLRNGKDYKVPKYHRLKSIHDQYVMFNVDNLMRDGRPLVLCEGEKDAMLLYQEASDLVDVATFAGAKGTIKSYWKRYILGHRRLLIAYDADLPGCKNANSLLDNFAWSERITAPAGNDIVDYFSAGGDVRGWITGIVNQSKEA